MPLILNRGKIYSPMARLESLVLDSFADAIDRLQGRSEKMARKITERQRLGSKLETLNDSEIAEVLDYISIMESMRRPISALGKWEDDLVALLADANENKRARQTFEWETVRRRADRRATPRAHS